MSAPRFLRGRDRWLQLVLAGLFLGCALPVDAQHAIFVLRHAERVEYESPDGVLSEAGEARARVLARLLGDAGVTAIYTSDRTRTNQTAQPLAELLHITPTIVGGQDQVEATVRLVRARDPDGRVVIVGHSDSVPRFLKAFGYSGDVVIGGREHDDIFVVLPLTDGRATVLRLNY